MDEVQEAPVVALHPEDELEERQRAITVAGLRRRRPEIAVEREPARRVVHAGHALVTGLAGGNERARDLIDGERGGTTSRCWEGPREARELPQHASRLARISFTERSAAAVTESAAP